MEFSPVMRMQLVNAIERVLHAPGNPSHDLKEMTIVLDYHMDKETVVALGKWVATTLKNHSRTFANVRCNLLRWVDDDIFRNEICPLSAMQLGRFSEGYEANVQTKRVELLCDNLKRFHARSKLVLVLTDYEYEIADDAKLKEALSPFLKYKILFTDGKSVKTAREYLF